MKNVRLLIVISGTVIAMTLLVKSMSVDASARHLRLWEELRLVGSFSERSDTATARSFHTHALQEAEALSNENIMRAISLTDLAYLDLRTHDYKGALTKLNLASEIEQKLAVTGTRDCDMRLIRSDLPRIELLLGQCYELNSQPQQALQHYRQCLQLAIRALSDRPVDWMVCDTMTDAFERFTNLCEATSDLNNLLPILKRRALGALPKGFGADLRELSSRALRRVGAPVERTQSFMTILNGSLEKP